MPLNNEKLIKLFKKFKVNFLKATSTPTGKIELRNEGIIKLFDRLDPIRQQDAVNYLVTLNQSVTESIKDSIINILKESK
ncbi:MAG: hypothetical protein IPJ20_19440 [Flammeovirgaceae bacterium]|nr:hypothetical protein [Flammeovirgaceae bacterium]